MFPGGRGEGVPNVLPAAVILKARPSCWTEESCHLRREIPPSWATFSSHPIARLCAHMPPPLANAVILSPQLLFLPQTCPPALQAVPSHYYPLAKRHCRESQESRAGILKPDCSGLNPASVITDCLALVNLLRCSSAWFPLL